MRLKNMLSGAAAGALTLALVAPGLAQQPQSPAPTSKPAAQSPAPSSAAQPATEKFDPAVARRITAEELKKRLDNNEKVILLDTRGNTGDAIAKGAVHVPNSKIEEWAKDIAKDTLIVTYCT